MLEIKGFIKDGINVIVREDAPGIQDETEYAAVEIKTEGGYLKAKKAIVVNDFYGDINISYLNLTDKEKEKLFDFLDAELHDEQETSKYLSEYAVTLENQRDELQEELEHYRAREEEQEEFERAARYCVR